MDVPWLAIALSAGHEQRLSPLRGVMYKGQTPPSPGCPLGVTQPTLRLNVKRLTIARERSQISRPAENTVSKSIDKVPRLMRRRAMGMNAMRGSGRRRTTTAGDKVRLSQTLPVSGIYIFRFLVCVMADVMVNSGKSSSKLSLFVRCLCLPISFYIIHLSHQAILKLVLENVLFLQLDQLKKFKLTANLMYCTA